MTPTVQSSAYWITGEKQGELRMAQLPECSEGQVKVRTIYSAISRGTESLVFNNQIPQSEYGRMQAPFQEGQFPFPVKYGYINVGVVEKGAESLLGKTVFCLYPHQSHYVVPADAVTPVPTGIPASRAVLAANMETAVNALWDSSATLGDKITVVGAGVVGCLIGYLASKTAGCEVQLVETYAPRKKIADVLNLSFAEPADALRDRDLVVHTSATERGLNTALSLAGFEATVLELSWFGRNPVTVDLGGAFHSRRLQIRSSQVGQIANSQRSRWDYKRRLALALSLLDDPLLDCLISDESDFKDLPSTLSALALGNSGALCHRIRYD